MNPLDPKTTTSEMDELLDNLFGGGISSTYTDHYTDPVPFIETPKGKERLEEMFMSWMSDNHPEDLL